MTLRMRSISADKRDFVQKRMATLLPLLVMFSALCGSMVALKLPQYPYVDSVVPYKDPGIGGTTCALYHSVSAAHSLQSAVDVSWKVGIAFTHPSKIIEQGFVMTGVLYLLWFIGSATCVITFIFLSSVIARIQPYPPNRLFQGEFLNPFSLRKFKKSQAELRFGTGSPFN